MSPIYGRPAHTTNIRYTVYLSEQKETYFFCRSVNFEKGQKWFSENFFSGYNGEKAIGEASVRNMTYRGAAKNIAQIVPRAKLIFILRNPVDRLYSHYNFEFRKGLANPLHSFSNKIREEDSLWRRGMLDKGMYHKHLRRYEEHFDREQIMPLLFEDFRSNTHKVVEEVFEFIGVDPSFEIDVSKRHNAGAYPRNVRAYQLVCGTLFSIRQTFGSRAFNYTRVISKPFRKWFYRGGTQKPPAMKPEDRAYLQDLYREPNARLADYLDRDLSHWT